MKKQILVNVMSVVACGISEGVREVVHKTSMEGTMLYNTGDYLDSIWQGHVINPGYLISTRTSDKKGEH